MAWKTQLFYVHHRKLCILFFNWIYLRVNKSALKIIFIHFYLPLSFKMSFKHSVEKFQLALSLIFTFSLYSCSSNEVRKLLDKLGVKKATGVDNLPSKMLKKWRQVFWHHLWHSCSISLFPLVLFQLTGS